MSGYDDLTPEQERELIESMIEYDRQQRALALKALAFARPPVPTQGDGDRRKAWIEEDAAGWACAWRRLAAFALLWIGRGYPGEVDGFNCYDAVDVAVFDYSNDGYGWSCGIVKFHQGAFRAWLDRDGECLF